MPNIMESLLQAGFKYANIGIAFVDKDGKFELVNPFLCKMTKYSQEELLTMDFEGLCDAMHVEPDSTEFKDLVAKKIDHYELEKKCKDKNGKDFWVSLSVTNLTPEGSDDVKIMRLTQDITSKKEAEAEVNRLNELMMGRELKMVALKKEIEDLKGN